MRILKSDTYINEKLAIQPVTNERFAKFKEPSVDEKARRFIEENDLVWNPVTMSYDCDGDVDVSEDIVTDGKLKIRFGKVGGYFDCNNNRLTTLEGAPKEVGRNFYCSDNKLTTLEGAPNKVGGIFNCSDNKLTTLEGAPNKVGGIFDCYRNELTTLKGAPQEVGGDFDCTDNKLTTLEGAPQKVGGDFYCSNNPNLVLSEDKPSWIEGKYITAL